MKTGSQRCRCGSSALNAGIKEGQQPKVAHRLDTEAYVRCFELPDAKEGIAAFKEKRKPRYSRR